MCMQNDGNLVLYKMLIYVGKVLKVPIWSTGTFNRPGFKAPYQLCVQPDGNLVIYDGANRALWASGTSNKGTPPHTVTMQNDGNFVLYDARKTLVWHTNTYNK